MKKTIIAILTTTIGGILATLIANKLLKFKLFEITSNSFSYLIEGTIVIPKWIVLLILLLFFIEIGLFVFFNPKLFDYLKKKFVRSKTNKGKRNIDELIKSQNIPDEIKLNILGFQNSDPSMIFKKDLCIKNFKPGTFTLAEISPTSYFLKTPNSFAKWFDSVFHDEVSLIESRYPKLIPRKTNMLKLKEQILGILDCKTSTGKSIKSEIWYQEYSDILRRILLFCIGKHPDYHIELYPNLTYGKKKTIFDIINFIEINRQPSLYDWLNISIAAGLLGVDEKTKHAATSEINKVETISLNKPGEHYRNSIKLISNKLWDVSKTKNRIDASQWLFQTLNFSKGIKFRLVAFPDDYIETIFLLKYYTHLLKTYTNLQIDFVPRSIKCGNDASYKDVVNLIEKFSFLKSSQRFLVHRNGPKLGTVNLQKLDLSIMSLIEQADLVESRGARNFEMMQGIKKDVCFGFMVCRDFSESTTGMKAEDAPLIFLKQSHGELAFSGFKERYFDPEYGITICPSKAIDKQKKFEGGYLSRYHKWDDKKKDRYENNQTFYTKNALDFHKKYGDSLENEVKEDLNNFHGNVLIVGCGSGKEVSYLEKRGCSTIGIDFSYEAISIARNLYPNLAKQFFVEDLYNLKHFSKNSFDGIVSNASLVHLLDRKDLFNILKSFKLVLKKNGLGFLRLIDKKIPNMEEYDRHLFGYTRWFVYYSLDEVEKVCSELDLSIKQSYTKKHSDHNNVYWVSVLFKKN